MRSWKRARSLSTSASLASRTAPASSVNRSINSPNEWQTWLSNPTSASASTARFASRPTGVRIRTGEPAFSGLLIFARAGFAPRPFRLRRAGEDAAEIGQRTSDRDVAITDDDFANRRFVCAGALLDHGDRLVHGAIGFVVTQGKHSVRQVCDVDG